VAHDAEQHLVVLEQSLLRFDRALEVCARTIQRRREGIRVARRLTRRDGLATGCPRALFCAQQRTEKRHDQLVGIDGQRGAHQDEG